MHINIILDPKKSNNDKIKNAN